MLLSQSRFSIPKEVRLTSTHYLITKIHNKRELGNYHSADIDYNDFLKIYKNCTKESYSFLTIDTTLPSGNLVRFRRDFSDSPI